MFKPVHSYRKEEGENREHGLDELKRIDEDFVNKKIEKGDIDPETGIEGALLFPVGIGPWGMTIDDNYHNEAMDAVYNSYVMTQYYDYTSDEEFWSSGAYDYMKKAVAFYEAWLEKEDSDQNADGYEYVIYAGYNEGSWARNPAIELAALKYNLKYLISASESLGIDAEKRETWKDIYNHLGDQPTTVIDGKTVLSLAEKQWDGSDWVDLPSPIPADGNALPLDAVIPGGVYNYFSSPEDLQMVWDTIDVFSENGAWSQINNFPRLFPGAVQTRYPIDTIVTKLVDVIDEQMVANLRIDDDAHGVEKSGSTETVNSMMLITADGITKIFPNWYADKDAKFANLRAKGAFTVSAEYDGTAQEAKNVTITSEAGEDMTLVVPWEEGATVKDSEGNIVETTKGEVENWPDEKTITFATTAGETYTVEKGEAEQEKADITGVKALDDMTVEYGTAFDKLNLPETVTVTLSDNTTADLKVIWSEAGYAADKAGVYTLTGTIDTGDKYTNSKNLTASIQITVKDKAGAGDKPGSRNDTKSDAPKTGNTAPIMGLILLGVLSGAAVLTLSRKRVK